MEENNVGASIMEQNGEKFHKQKEDKIFTMSSTSINKKGKVVTQKELELHEQIASRIKKFDSNITSVDDKQLLISPFDKEILENALLLNATHAVCLKLTSKMLSGFGYYFEGKKNNIVKQIINRPNDEINESFGQILNNISIDYKKRGEFGIAVMRKSTGEYYIKYCNINNLAILPYDGNLVSTSKLIKQYFEIQQNTNNITSIDTLSVREYEPLRWNTNIANGKWYLARYWNQSARNLFFPEPEYLSALYPIAENKKIYDYNNIFFDNNARPDFIMVVKGVDKLSNNQKLDIETFIANNFKGVSNAHRTLYLQFDDKDVEVNIIPVNQKSHEDAAFRLLRMDNRDDIARAWNVPPKAIGISSAGSLGSGSEALGALKLLKEYSKTDQQTIEEFISNIFMKLSGVNPQLRFRRIELTNEKDKAIIYQLLADLTDEEGNPILPYKNVTSDLDLENESDNKKFVISAKKTNLSVNEQGRTRGNTNIDEGNKNRMGATK